MTAVIGDNHHNFGHYRVGEQIEKGNIPHVSPDVFSLS